MRAVSSRHCLREFSAIINDSSWLQCQNEGNFVLNGLDVFKCRYLGKTHPISLMIRPIFCSSGVSLSRVLTANIFIVVSRRQNTGSGDNCQSVTNFKRES